MEVLARVYFALHRADILIMEHFRLNLNLWFDLLVFFFNFVT